jgi:uncharacterized integral membrane protein
MVKVKLITALVLIGLTFIIVLQNTQPVETKILFLTITMPRATLLGITMMAGVATGILISLGLAAKRSGK